MHVLEPKQTKLNNAEVEKLLSDLNISKAQLPKIKIEDPTLTEDFEISDIIKIERVVEGVKSTYYRVVGI